MLHVYTVKNISFHLCIGAYDHKEDGKSGRRALTPPVAASPVSSHDGNISIFWINVTKYIRPDVYALQLSSLLNPLSQPSLLPLLPPMPSEQQPQHPIANKSQ